MTTNNTNTSSNNAASVAHAENIIAYKALMMATPYNMTAEAVDKEIEGIDPTMMVMMLERLGVASAEIGLARAQAAGAIKASADARAAFAKDKHWYNSTTAKVGYGVLGTAALTAAAAVAYQKVTGQNPFSAIASVMGEGAVAAATAVADTATEVAEAVTA